jgi:hypothetical protein
MTSGLTGAVIGGALARDLPASQRTKAILTGAFMPSPLISAIIVSGLVREEEDVAKRQAKHKAKRDQLKLEKQRLAALGPPDQLPEIEQKRVEEDQGRLKEDERRLKEDERRLKEDIAAAKAPAAS